VKPYPPRTLPSLVAAVLVCVFAAGVHAAPGGPEFSSTPQCGPQDPGYAKQASYEVGTSMRTFGGEGADRVTAVHLTDSRDLLLTGYTYGLVGVASADRRFFVRRYSAAGCIVWTDVFDDGVPNGSSDSSALPNNIVVDAEDNTVVVGTVTTTSAAGFVRKYSPSGALLWIRSAGTRVVEVAIDSDGDIYIYAQAPNSFIRKYNADGQALWTRTLSGVSALAVDASNGEVVVAGTDSNGGAFLRRYSTQGVELWQQSVAEQSALHPGSLNIDGDGNIVVVSGYNAREAVLHKYDAIGTALWSQPIPQLNFVRVDEVGNVFIAILGAVSGAYIKKLDPSGATLWTKVFAVSSGIQTPADLAVNRPGDILSLVGSCVTSSSADEQACAILVWQL